MATEKLNLLISFAYSDETKTKSSQQGFSILILCLRVIGFALLMYMDLLSVSTYKRNKLDAICRSGCCHTSTHF